jgi:carboxypeptidase Taq
MQNYQQLEERFAEIHKLDSIGSVLFWDSKVMMPATASANRGEQMGTLTRVIHSKRTDPALADLLAAADNEHNELDNWQQANLREMKRLTAHAQAVENDLAEAFARAQNDAGMAWLKAKSDNDFASFVPYLETVFELQTQIAEAKADALGLSLYDAMLDEHDPGTSTETVDQLFAELEGFLPDFVQTVGQAQQHVVRQPLPEVPVANLHALIARILPNMGWPADARIDHTEHPFAISGVPGDPRITTHYSPSNPLMTLLAALHECGHGMYELNLPKNNYAYQPVGGHRGASTHESQSLGMEMLACRSAPFLQWMFERLREEFGATHDAWTDTNLFAHYRHVQPSFIRVNADEVTYPLHVILRYNLEQQILKRELAVRDIPDAWNEEMQRLLGIRPETFAEGCLQDIHWSMGLVGYFPTYLLGALKAAQFFATAKSAHPALEEELGDGNFQPWLGWLNDNVHQHGSLYGSDELVVRATGRGLETAPLVEHLKRRYLADD